MDRIKIIDVKESVFADNNLKADETRKKLKNDGTFLFNLMSSPGAGKTTFLRALVKRLKNSIKIGVMEADIDGDVDAQAMSQAGVKAIQIHTGGMCHLDAGMTNEGLAAIESSDFDLVVLENVGNLVCPAEFDTGAVKSGVILSVPEGSDKPLKYPLMFSVCDILIINKIDVMKYFDFNLELVRKSALSRNPNIEIFEISAKTGEGVDEVSKWFENQIHQWKHKG